MRPESEKQSYAFDLFCIMSVTGDTGIQAKIAKKCNVSEALISRWKKNYNWVERERELRTGEKQLKPQVSPKHSGLESVEQCENFLNKVTGSVASVIEDEMDENGNFKRLKVKTFNDLKDAVSLFERLAKIKESIGKAMKTSDPEKNKLEISFISPGGKKKDIKKIVSDSKAKV